MATFEQADTALKDSRATRSVMGGGGRNTSPRKIKDRPEKSSRMTDLRLRKDACQSYPRRQRKSERGDALTHLSHQGPSRDSRWLREGVLPAQFSHSLVTQVVCRQGQVGQSTAFLDTSTGQKAMPSGHLATFLPAETHT